MTHGGPLRSRGESLIRKADLPYQTLLRGRFRAPKVSSVLVPGPLWARTTLGIRNWNPAQAYDRVDQRFNLLAKATEQGLDAVVDGQPVRIDADWVPDRLVAASLQDLPVWSGSVAIDGTDIDTWAKRPEWVDDVDLEFDGDDGDDIAPVKAPSKKKGKKKPIPAYGYDEEGAPIFTRDRDARWGHRSASRRAHPYPARPRLRTRT
jgi:hypothetical protein